MSFFLWWYAASALVIFFMVFFGVGKTSYHNYGDSGWKSIGLGLAAGLMLGAFWPVTMGYVWWQSLAGKGWVVRIGNGLASFVFGERP